MVSFRDQKRPQKGRCHQATSFLLRLGLPQRTQTLRVKAGNTIFPSPAAFWASKYSCCSDLRFFCFVSLWLECSKRMYCLPHQVVGKVFREDGTPLAPLSVFFLAVEWGCPHGPGHFPNWTCSPYIYISSQLPLYIFLYNVLIMWHFCLQLELSSEPSPAFLPCEQSFNSL